MAITIARVADPAGVTATSSVSTYTAASTGTASSDRIIVCAVTTKGTPTVTGVTINSFGQDITMTPGTFSTFSTMGAWIFHTLVPVGSTADVKVSFTDNLTSLNNHVTLYSVTGADPGVSSVKASATTDMDATNPCSVAINVPTGGMALAVACGAASG